MKVNGVCPFYPTVCHVCKSFFDAKKVEKTLKRCQGCKLIAYCSVKHQEQHWPEHKEFCKVVQSLTSKLNLSFIYDSAVGVTSKEAWSSLRSQMKLFCELMLGRALTSCETEMLFFPRICFTCHKYDQANLIDCESCHSVTYCSPDHMTEDAEFHNKSCGELRAALTFDVLVSVGDSCDKTDLFRLPLSCDSPQAFCSMIIKSMSPSNDPMQPQVNSILFSCPLTFVHGAFMSGLNFHERLEVHLVGAGSFESEHLDMWNIVFNWFPKLQAIHLVLIGPDVVTVDSSIYQQKDLNLSIGRSFTVEFRRGQLYHAYTRSTQYIQPDMIVMFNCGLSEFIGGEEDKWQKSIPSIVTAQCPVLLTSYTALEAENDLKRLTESNQDMTVIIRGEKNLFSVKKPLRDWEQFYPGSDRLVFYHNAFVSLLLP